MDNKYIRKRGAVAIRLISSEASSEMADDYKIRSNDVTLCFRVREIFRRALKIELTSTTFSRAYIFKNINLLSILSVFYI